MTTPIQRAPSAQVSKEMLARLQRLKTLDQSPQDRDPRPGYVDCLRTDGHLQALVGDSEYVAKVEVNRQPVMAEHVTLMAQGSHPVTASHYQAGSIERGTFPDLTIPGPPRQPGSGTAVQWYCERADQAALIQLGQAAGFVQFVLYTFDNYWGHP